jgi:hypothetical protein
MSESTPNEVSQGELPLVHYETPECVADLSFDPSNETIWATQQQIAALYGVGVAAINKHIANIYTEAELTPEGTFSKMEIVRLEGTRSVRRLIEHYNLDVILSVGCRVSSKKATEFRRWATQTLRQYITQGFALDESRLQRDPGALKELAAKVRALRANEMNIYQAVREVFAFGSSDYDKTSPEVRKFHAKIQDKFLYAVTGLTAAEIKLARANHTLPSMGLTSMRGEFPKPEDVTIGKNYLSGDELYGLHILCEQFLLLVESKAIRGQTFTMRQLSEKFDQLLALQGHTVFAEYVEFIANKANAHAHKEFDLWRERTKLLPASEKATA